VPHVCPGEREVERMHILLFYRRERGCEEGGGVYVTLMESDTVYVLSPMYVNFYIIHSNFF
jgi:hypothetical protein